MTKHIAMLATRRVIDMKTWCYNSPPRSAATADVIESTQTSMS